MDKFVVRRPRPSLSTESSQNSESSDERRAKRPKTAHESDSKGQGHQVVHKAANLDDEDDETSGGDGDSGLIADSYDGIPFEEPLAAIEATDEAIDGSFDAAEGVPADATPLYRSSIYVDAFNIALDTVLEQEEHLFSEKEKAVFAAWRDLDYEAQYL